MEPVLEIPYPGQRAPAPGRLHLVQRFVNTVDFEHGREMLSDPGRLRSVLAGLGLLASEAKVTDADLRRDVCRWLFYDASRNRSARWCQMAVCGNRTKTRAYRARRR